MLVVPTLSALARPSLPFWIINPERLLEGSGSTASFYGGPHGAFCPPASSHFWGLPLASTPKPFPALLFHAREIIPCFYPFPRSGQSPALLHQLLL